MSVCSSPAFFNPKQFPGLVTWFDGNDPAGTGVQPADATAVTTWVDKAGNNNQTQSTGANKLIFKTNIQNGRGVMRSTNLKFMTGGTTNLPTGSGARTVFVVGMTTDVTQNNIFYDWGFGDVSRHWAMLFTQFVTSPRFINDLSGNYSQETSVVILNNVYYIGSLNYAAGGAPSTTVYTMNGASATTGSGGSGATPNTGTTASCISSYIPGTTGYSVYGDICEILVYNSALNAAQMNAVTYYLQCKWQPTPQQVPGLVRWFDANDPSANGTQPNNGDAVTTWVDKSGYGNNLTQSTGANKPTYETNVVNGKSTVRFPTSTQVMTQTGTTGQIVGATARTGYFVVSSATLDSAYQQWFGYFNTTGTYKNWLLAWQGTGFYKIDLAGDNILASTGAISANTFYVYEYVYTGGALNNTTMTINGTTVSHNNATSTPDGATPIAGQMGGAATIQFDVAEIYEYTGALTAAQRSVQRQYLYSKYGITGT